MRMVAQNVAGITIGRATEIVSQGAAARFRTAGQNVATTARLGLKKAELEEPRSKSVFL